MSVWAIIPVKQPDAAKGRLAGALSEAERGNLARAMLAHVLDAVSKADHVDRAVLLGPSRLGASEELPLLPDPGLGLNPALQTALDHVARQGASRMIVLFADLPLLTTQEVQLLAAAPEGEVAIAPDRHGTGTNALSLPLPEAGGFTFAFGPDSFALHNEEAERLGLRLEVIHSRGLASDVDEPADLADAAGLIGGTG